MGEFENGDIVIVHDFDGYGMGRGFINMNSKDPDPYDDKKAGSGDRSCISGK